MKINEIVESKSIRPSAKKAIPRLAKYDGLNDPYTMYRFGLSLAGSPTNATPPAGAIGSSLVTIGYTDADQETIDASAKQFGAKKTSLGGKSEELKNTGKNSPVAKIKKNKYGI